MFTYACPLRWSDMDAQGHVNNAAVVDFLQEARVAFFRAGPTSRLLADGVVVVGHKVEYVGSIAYSEEPLPIELSLASVRGARFEVAYDMFQAGDLVVRARTVLCPFDFETGRPALLPEDVRDFLRGHLADLVPLRTLEAPALEGRGTATPVHVRWSDNDEYGHVNNTVAYDYVQQARIQATTAWDPAMARAGSEGSRYNWLVARQDVDYVAQMSRRAEPYLALTAPVRIGSTSMTLACEIVDPTTGQVCTRARTVLVCADADLSPISLPDSVRVAVAPLLVDADEGPRSTP